jgi:hypothetical protein
MNPKITSSVLLICLCIVLVGCSGAAVQVQAAQPVASMSAKGKEFIEIYNCDQQIDLHRSLVEEAQVTSTTTFSNFAAATTTGDSLQLSEELIAILTAQIESTYQKNVEAATTRVSQVDLLVPVGKIRAYDIFWTQETYSSSVVFEFNDAKYTAAYTYTVNIPDAAVSSEIACTG